MIFNLSREPASLMICEDRLVRVLMAWTRIHLSNLGSSDLREADESHTQARRMSVSFIYGRQNLFYVKVNCIIPDSLLKMLWQFVFSESCGLSRYMCNSKAIFLDLKWVWVLYKGWNFRPINVCMRTNNASRPAEHKKDHLEREERTCVHCYAAVGQSSLKMNSDNLKHTLWHLSAVEVNGGWKHCKSFVCYSWVKRMRDRNQKCE